MARPRRSLNTARIAPRGEDLSKLSSEVLKLHLQVLNLPITGSKVQLLARLKRALTGKATQSKRKPGQPQCTRPSGNKTPTEHPSTADSGIDATQGRRLSIPEDSALSDRASLSSIEDMLESDVVEDLFPTSQVNATPSVQRSVLPSRTSYPSLYKALWMPFVQTAPSAQRNPANLSLLQVWHLLWVFQGLWTAIWRTKYSGVSTLI